MASAIQKSLVLSTGRRASGTVDHERRAQQQQASAATIEQKEEDDILRFCEDSTYVQVRLSGSTGFQASGKQARVLKEYAHYVRWLAKRENTYDVGSQSMSEILVREPKKANYMRENCEYATRVGRASDRKGPLQFECVRKARPSTRY
jgi:phage/plasmid-associated DNA primase